MFDLPVAASSAGHDAIARDGARVEIKATYGSAGVALRKTSDLAASALIVLRHSRTTPRPTRGRIQRAARDRTTGGRPRSKQWTGAHEPGRLRALNETVAPVARVPRRNGTVT